MSAISSRKLAELLKKQDRARLFLKMLLDSSPFSNPIVYLRWKSKRLSYFVKTTGNQQIKLSYGSNEELSEVLFEKLVKRDMYFPNCRMAHQSFSVFRPLSLAGRINGTGFGLLPTPTATARSNMGATLKQVRKRRPLKDRKNEKGTGGQISLTDFLIYHAMIALSTDPAKLNQTMPFEIQKRLLGVLPTKEQVSGKIPSWEHWPSEPPFFCGVDGISSELDGISFSVWQ